MADYYLNRPLPVFDGKEFSEFERQSELHFVEQKKCRHWKRVYSELTKSLSHFGDCHNPDSKTHNCGYNLCPIRNGDFYNHERRRESNKVTNIENVNKMLKDIDNLEKCLNDDRELLIFVEEFRKDLNILFEMIKDDEGDFRSNLVVLLLDIVNQVNICKFKEQELVIIRDMTTSLLTLVTGEKLDDYINLAIDRDMLTIRLQNVQIISEED